MESDDETMDDCFIFFYLLPVKDDVYKHVHKCKRDGFQITENK